METTEKVYGELEKVCRERGTALQELERICRERGITNSNAIMREIENDYFEIFGLHNSEYILIDKNQNPKVGDYTLFHYKNKIQLVLLSGIDCFGKPMVCKKCINYPETVLLAGKPCLLGRAVAYTLKNDIVYL